MVYVPSVTPLPSRLCLSRLCLSRLCLSCPGAYPRRGWTHSGGCAPPLPPCGVGSGGRLVKQVAALAQDTGGTFIPELVCDSIGQGVASVESGAFAAVLPSYIRPSIVGASTKWWRPIPGPPEAANRFDLASANCGGNGSFRRKNTGDVDQYDEIIGLRT